MAATRINEGLEPYLKFVTPAFLAIFATLVSAIESSHLDLASLEVGFFGLVAATVSFVVANGSTGLKRYAKALAPAILALVGIGLHYIFSGEFSDTDTRAAVVMGLSALVTLVVPNSNNAAVNVR